MWAGSRQDTGRAQAQCRQGAGREQARLRQSTGRDVSRYVDRDVGREQAKHR